VLPAAVRDDALISGALESWQWCNLGVVWLTP